MVALSADGWAKWIPVPVLDLGKGTVVGLAVGTTWLSVFISKAKEPKDDGQLREGTRPEPEETSQGSPIKADLSRHGIKDRTSQ